MAFKDDLKTHMKKHNLKINDMCECTGLSYSKIYGYLNGTVPKDDDLEILCEACGWDTDEIIFNDLNISVAEAARTMQRSPAFVKYAVQTKQLVGICDGKMCHIPRRWFEIYMLSDGIAVDLISNLVNGITQALKMPLAATSDNVK